jgi:rubrerythrin
MDGGAFPLDRYLDASRTLSLEDYDWSLATKHPLSREIERVMVYMLRIEGQTLFYVRDLLNTRTAYIPEVSSFLTVWLYEEERHSRIFKRFLRERGIDLPRDDHAQVREASRGGIRERFEALGARWMARMTEHFVAVHMIWGVTQELSTLHAYRRLAERCGHPLLRELCLAITKDERRHYAFYANMAERYLQPRPAQVLTRFLLERWWQPVGMGVHAPDHVHFMSIGSMAIPRGCGSRARWTRRSMRSRASAGYTCTNAR